MSSYVHVRRRLAAAGRPSLLPAWRLEGLDLRFHRLDFSASALNREQ